MESGLGITPETVLSWFENKFQELQNQTSSGGDDASNGVIQMQNPNRLRIAIEQLKVGKTTAARKFIKSALSDLAFAKLLSREGILEHDVKDDSDELKQVKVALERYTQ